VAVLEARGRYPAPQGPQGRRLVTAHRRGRMVLYQRTPAATALLAAVRSDQATG